MLRSLSKDDYKRARLAVLTMRAMTADIKDAANELPVGNDLISVCQRHIVLGADDINVLTEIVSGVLDWAERHGAE